MLKEKADRSRVASEVVGREVVCRVGACFLKGSLLVIAGSCASGPEELPLSLAGSCASGPEEPSLWCTTSSPSSLVPALVARRGLLVGDADGRRRSAACGGPARPDE